MKGSELEAAILPQRLSGSALSLFTIIGLRKSTANPHLQNCVLYIVSLAFLTAYSSTVYSQVYHIRQVYSQALER